MANNRVYQVQGLTSNGVTIGGLARISFDLSYKDIIRSPADGAVGPEDIDRIGQRVGITMECTDVLQALPLLLAARGAMSFFVKESGKVTYKKYSIASGDALTVWTGMRLNFRKNQDARLSMTGVLQFASATKTFSDALKMDDLEVTADRFYPTRLYRPNTVSFDPAAVAGAGDAISILHVDSVDLSIEGDVEEDYGDTDIGITVVDIKRWRNPRTQLTFRDSVVGSAAGAQAEATARLLGLGRGALSVGLLGLAGAANKTLTVLNAIYTGASPDHAAEVSTFNVTLESMFRDNTADPDVIYSVDGGGTTTAIIALA